MPNVSPRTPTNLIYQIAPASIDPELATIAHPQFISSLSLWNQIRDCVSGERRIKSKGAVYLPILPDQDPEEYSSYLDRAVFFNATTRTLQGLLGSIFRRETKVNNAPKKVEDLLPTISKTRVPFQIFIQSTGEELLTTGRVGTLADLPIQKNQPPYLINYPAESILNWRTTEDPITGKTILDQVVLVEDQIVPSTFGSATKKVVRVLELDRQGPSSIYIQRVLDPSNSYRELSVHVPMVLGQPLPFIPFQFFGPSSLETTIQRPPLEDISNLNISHYRSYADLEHGRHYTAIPVYWVRGQAMGEDDVFSVGPNRIWKLEENDEAGLLEFNGHGLTFLENAIDKKEAQISMLGGRLIGQTRRTAAQSSISYELLQAGEEAILNRLTSNLSLGMTEVLQWLLILQGEERNEEMRVEVNQDFAQARMSAREIRAMTQIYQEKLMPLDLLFAIFKNNGVIPADVSLEEFQDLLEKPGQIPEMTPTEMRLAGKQQQTSPAPKLKSKTTLKKPKDKSQVSE